MKKDYSKLFDVLQWIFVGLCLIMSIGMGLNVGTIFMIIAAALAVPLKPVKSIWSKVLRIEAVDETQETVPLKWWQLKAKSAQKKTNKENEKKIKNNNSKKAWKPIIITFVFLTAVIVGASTMETSKQPTLKEPTVSDSSISTEQEDTSSTESDVTTESTTSTPETTQAPSETTKPNEPVATEPVSFDLSSIPAFSNKAYVAVNNNTPFFTSTDFTTKSFESYSNLDSIGRCGVAYACVGKDLMPTEERGSIGSVKPTGWQTIKYDNVDGKYLYNRCHLIGYQLSGENANTKNLITGTRYLNVTGMLPFENMVADYVKETNYHVLYRVTPIFSGNNLVASGVLMEAESVEDKGEGILFCVYCYNNQPGITIDYSNGNSQSAAGAAIDDTPSQETESSQVEHNESTYILNTNTKKFHRPDCASAKKISDKNKGEFTGDRADLIAQGYDPCKNCNP